MKENAFPPHLRLGSRIAPHATRLPGHPARIHVQVFGLNLKQSAFLSVLPWVVMAVGTNVSGWTADYLINNRILTTTKTRKLLQTIGSVGPGVCLMCVGAVGGQAPCDMCINKSPSAAASSSSISSSSSSINHHHHHQAFGKEAHAYESHAYQQEPLRSGASRGHHRKHVVHVTAASDTLCT